MKAAVNTRYGPPEVVRVVEVPEPVAKDGEMLVKVHATTVNRTDCGFRAAKPFFLRGFTGLTRPRATILGGEFAGVVESVGGGVRSLRPGDRVFGFCMFGAHAEYLTVPADGPLATIPAGVGYAEIAPSMEGSYYAYSLMQAAGIRNGQDVLVYGATGAIGSAAVQLLKNIGATVTAVCAGHVDVVERLGADRIVDSTAEDFTKDEQTYDVVFDAVGKSSFRRCRPLLKPRGTYLVPDLGPWAQNPILTLVTPWFGGRKVVLPFSGKQDQEVARHFRRLIESGAFKPVIDRTYPLDRILDAYRYVETGRKLGNVVIIVEASG